MEETPKFLHGVSSAKTHTHVLLIKINTKKRGPNHKRPLQKPWMPVPHIIPWQTAATVFQQESSI